MILVILQDYTTAFMDTFKMIAQNKKYKIKNLTEK
jgi:hypothetical protein